jgi:SAM-dependent methyltransferase
MQLWRSDAGRHCSIRLAANITAAGFRRLRPSGRWLIILLEVSPGACSHQCLGLGGGRDLHPQEVTGLESVPNIGRLPDARRARPLYGRCVQFDSGIARHEMWELGERIVQRAGVLTGEDVLDVACGTGSAAIRAAQSGARVVGLDLTPPLFDARRREAAQAGTVRWVGGVAAALPFSDGSFDAVVSVFGAAFARRQHATARELARVLRRGGRLAMFNWTARGGTGELLSLLAAQTPDQAEPPLAWGDEAHVRHLFAGSGVRLSFGHEIARHPLRGVGALAEPLEHHAGVVGPLIALRRAAERRGSWHAVQAEVAALCAADGVRADGHYLVVLGRKDG